MAGFSYPRSYRLRTRSDYACCRHPKYSRLLCRCLVFFRKNSLAHARLGCTVSKKMGKAFERNLFRRRLKEAFRTSPFAQSLSFDIHIIPQQAVRLYSWDDVLSLMAQLDFLQETSSTNQRSRSLEML